MKPNKSIAQNLYNMFNGKTTDEYINFTFRVPKLFLNEDEEMFFERFRITYIDGSQLLIEDTMEAIMTLTVVPIADDDLDRSEPVMRIIQQAVNEYKRMSKIQKLIDQLEVSTFWYANTDLSFPEVPERGIGIHWLNNELGEEGIIVYKVSEHDRTTAIIYGYKVYSNEELKLGSVKQLVKELTIQQTDCRNVLFA